MYGLQTAPSPRRTNCKIQRNIHFGNQHHDCSSNFGWKLWNSHNSNFSQLKFCHSISYIFLVFSYNSNPSPSPSPLPLLTLTLAFTPTLIPTLGVTLTLVLATPWENSRHFATPPLFSPRKCRLRNDCRNSTGHQYWISAVVSQMTFRGENSGEASENVGCFLGLAWAILPSIVPYF